MARAAYELFDEVDIIGIADGYSGLMKGEYSLMRQSDFSGILTRGGTILGTSRQSYQSMKEPNGKITDKAEAMKKNYRDMRLDCLMILGGNGTHKTAHLLSEEGLNVIALPKTIDNDLWGTDVTFGFHTAVDIATEVIDRIHTTADSHGRVMVVEMMGNKAGWLTLYSGIAGGADVILLPELPYSVERVAEFVNKRVRNGKGFSIVAVAEGALNRAEAAMKKKERAALRAENPYCTAAHRVAHQIARKTGLETRAVVPGHIQRGGSPSAYDRVLSTRFGIHAARLMKEGIFGVTVALQCERVTHNPLKEVAGKTKLIPVNHQMIAAARQIGICFGDE